MSIAQTTSQGLTTTTTPLDNIGLAFSGGGFRAASFGLGNLSYLHELKQQDGTPLLRNVTYMSSASGGTITTAMYAYYNTDGKGFEEFYKALFENLSGVKLLNKVFDKLNTDSVWKENKNKKRNFINAFALAYDDLLFDHALAGALIRDTPVTHLDEVCFNTTDFYKGLLFRQALKLRPDSKPDSTFLYGNYIMHRKNDEDLGRKAGPENKVENKFRLGDMLAASSCFPAGFEPIVFPGDFGNKYIRPEDIRKNLHIELQEVKWPELDNLYNDTSAKQIAKKEPKPIDVDDLAQKLQNLPLEDSFEAGFMDGGIADNQGLESLMRANDRRVKGDTDFKQFDLMLVNDVSSHYMDPYKPSPKIDRFKGIRNLRINTLIIICWFIIIMGAASLAYSLFFQADGLCSKLVAILGSFLIIVPAIALSIIFYIKRYVGGSLKDGKGLDLTKNFSDAIVKNMFSHFGRTPIGIIIQMLKDRFTSVITLNMDVFLKRVRQLLYQQFMDQGHATYRLKTNHIYDLSFANDRNRKRNDSESLSPSANLQIIAQQAFQMGTTLWFDTQDKDKNSEAAVIACGHFTTCYNLLEYLTRIKKDIEYYDMLTPAHREKIEFLYAKLSSDYTRFKQDPFWLYNELGAAYKIPGFIKCDMSQFPSQGDYEGLR